MDNNTMEKRYGLPTAISMVIGIVIGSGVFIKGGKVLALTKEIVSKRCLTCLMITHNMQSALTKGNRTIVMDSGRIIVDVSGQARESMTVPGLLELFRERSGRELDNDRMLLR